MGTRGLDFLHCNRCLLPLSVVPNDSSHRPFALAHCGHVFCAVCQRSSGPACTVCRRSGLKWVKLESPMPDYAKRLFGDVAREGETERESREQDRKSISERLTRAALSLKEASEAVVDVLRMLEAEKESSSLARKRRTQSLRFQCDQWRSLASANVKVWEKAKQTRTEMKRHETKYEAALAESRKDASRMAERVRELEAELKRRDDCERHSGGRIQHNLASRVLTPPFFDPTSGNPPSPFFKKITSSSSSSSSLVQSAKKRGLETYPQTSTPAKLRVTHRRQSPFVDAKRLQTPSIFVTEKFPSQSPYFSDKSKRK